MTALERRTAPPEECVVTAPYRDRQRLGAELRRMSERGLIERCGPIRLVDGQWVARYVRLREPRPKAPLYVTGFALGMGAVAGVAAMLWHARYVILYGLGALAALAILIGLIGFVSARVRGCACVLHGPRCGG